MNDRLASLSPLVTRRAAGFAGTAALALAAWLACAWPLAAQMPSLHDFAPAAGKRIEPVVARQGMVVAQESRAARIGVEFLQKGGNAVDAAVATGFALAVTYPRAGNLGGGVYMVIHLADRGLQTAIDYRETAPAATTRDVFLDEKGEADQKKSRDSALSIGVPGTVAGLALAHSKYGSGKFTLEDLLAPAIRLAREGFPIEDDIADSLPRAKSRLEHWPSSAKIFLKDDGRPLGPGATLLQSDLADTLTAIAHQGPQAFYQGPVADKIVAAVRAAGGLMTSDDLKSYQPIEHMPARGSYRGYDVVSMPPSSSGGVVLIEILNILEGYPDLAADSTRRAHLTLEAMKLAYADRAAFLGDPASVDVPMARLISKSHATELRRRIDDAKARPARDLLERGTSPREGDNTTHFSVVDRFGNAVSNTYTLNYSYGVGLVADGTGVLLNNELDDFAAKPGAPNAYGLVGGEANAPGPGKRPLSSMTPTILLKDGKAFLVTGSPGGSRIITTVLQVILNVIDRKLSIEDAVADVRIHHQWSPDEAVVERGFSRELMLALQERGHKVVERPPGTSANSILVTPDGFVGAADNRTRGALAAGY
jgi:gamma-glutamyltranspeptidase/glutathione hydrolase